MLLGALIKGMLSTEMLLNPTQWQTEKDLLDCQWARVYYSHRGNKQWLVSANFYGNNVFLSFKCELQTKATSVFFFFF